LATPTLRRGPVSTQLLAAQAWLIIPVAVVFSSLSFHLRFFSLQPVPNHQKICDRCSLFVLTRVGFSVLARREGISCVIYVLKAGKPLFFPASPGREAPLSWHGGLAFVLLQRLPPLRSLLRDNTAWGQIDNAERNNSFLFSRAPSPSDLFPAENNSLSHTYLFPPNPNRHPWRFPMRARTTVPIFSSGGNLAPADQAIFSRHFFGLEPFLY